MKQRQFIETIRGAVARGWTHNKNAKKTLDTDLAEAIVDEVIKLFTTSQVTETVTDILMTRARGDIKDFESHIYHKLAHEMGDCLLENIDVDMERSPFLQAFNYKMKIYYLADIRSVEGEK